MNVINTKGQRMSTLDNVHKKVLNSILNREHGSPGQQSQNEMSDLAEKDALLRQAVSDLYMALATQADPNQAVEILATHVAMMVEMINEFKAKRG
jgi:hypothetical protein